VHDGVVSAGLIACRTQGGARGELQDDTRSVLTLARATHAIDWSSSDFERALAAGITSVAIAPGSANLVGGLACTVKTAGERVSQPEAALAISLTSAALGRSTAQGFFVFGAAENEPGLAAAPDGGPETTGRTTRGTRAPTSYSGGLALLKELCTTGAGPFTQAKRGDLPVTIEAWDRHEVLRAIQFAHDQGLKGSIRGAPLAGDPAVVAALRASGLGVIVGPYTAEQTRRSLESLERLSEAGVPVAFALDAPGHSPSDLRLSAVRALSAGAKPEAVWKALTEDAARLAGVGESTGQLARERDADFVLWSGNPLDLTSRVVAVYVDGQRAWPVASPH
jgi:imidazolonepropionase-like amidohydrolase